MVIAFVLINTEIDSMEKVLGSLKDIDEVKEAFSLYGTYDIIVKIEAEDQEKLNAVVSGKIRKLRNVRSTLTMIAIK